MVYYGSTFEKVNYKLFEKFVCRIGKEKKRDQKPQIGVGRTIELLDLKKKGWEDKYRPFLSF